MKWCGVGGTWSRIAGDPPSPILRTVALSFENLRTVAGRVTGRAAALQ